MRFPIRLATAALPLFATVVLPPGALLAQTPERAAVVARIDSIVTSALAAPYAGFSIAVVKGHDTLAMKAYGFANLELRVPATPATVFRIGSLTKQFTSAMVMQLVEAGKIGLEDSLPKYLPAVPRHWRSITIHQLLNHTSGIPSYTDIGPRVRTLLVTGTPRDSMIALLRGDSLMFPPGTGFYYNNTGYYLLGMILERITGQPYATYFADHIAKPLGLERTLYCATGPLIADRASGYDRQGPVLVNTAYIDMDLPYAAGSICSTPRDLVRWGNALATGKVVRPESYRLMTTPVTLPSVRPMTYGFGLTADTLGTHRVVQHGGNVNGFAAGLMYMPDDSLFVAVLSNTSSAPSSGMAMDIARAVVGVPRVSVAPLDEPTTAEERAAFVGRYLVVQPDGSRREAQVVDQGGRLAVNIPGQAPLLLQRQNRQVFTVQGQPAARVLFEMSGSRVTGFILDRGSRPLPATRIP